MPSGAGRFQQAEIFLSHYPIANVLVTITPNMIGSGKETTLYSFSALPLVLLLIAASPRVAAPNAQRSGNASQKVEVQKSEPVFSAADAARLLVEIQRALEGDNQRGFLKLFDARRMPYYAAFQDQMAEFFEKYESFRFRYHLTEASSEDKVGIVLADAELELTPASANVPSVRRNAQLRLVTAWDGKAWKIVDWSPRDILN